jgi:hypothetical protein
MSRLNRRNGGPSRTSANGILGALAAAGSTSANDTTPRTTSSRLPGSTAISASSASTAPSRQPPSNCTDASLMTALRSR